LPEQQETADDPNADQRNAQAAKIETGSFERAGVFLGSSNLCTLLA
jgi:hypothetical protein